MDSRNSQGLVYAGLVAIVAVVAIVFLVGSGSRTSYVAAPSGVADLGAGDSANLGGLAAGGGRRGASVQDVDKINDKLLAKCKGWCGSLSLHFGLMGAKWYMVDSVLGPIPQPFNNFQETSSKYNTEAEEVISDYDIFYYGDTRREGLDTGMYQIEYFCTCYSSGNSGEEGAVENARRTMGWPRQSAK